MAVQAQYPSNVLFLNRNLQESDKANVFSIQAQTEEACPDQIHSSRMMIFNTNGNQNANHNNNGINEPKRGRDTSSALKTPLIDSFSAFHPQTHQQQQQPQMLELSQLHHPSQNLLVSTGLKLSTSPNHLHHHHHQQQHQMNPNSNPIRSSFLSDHINHQMKQHQQEIDQLLHFQGEQLQRILSEKRQRQYRSLLSAADESLKRRLIEKQSELEKAVRRNAELEARAVQLSMESQLWQAKARAQESTAASLQSQLHQALINGGRRIGGEMEQQQQQQHQQQQQISQVDDAESVYIDPDRVVAAEVESRFGPVCKSCRIRPANMVMMPCRHLCVCAVCDGGAVAACPCCFTIKESSVEVFLP